MDESDSQKLIKDSVIDQEPEDLAASLSDTQLTVIIKAGGHEAAYTAEEARKLANGILSAYHQRGWGENIVPTADYIYDLADVVDDKMGIEDVKKKWDHDGEFGGGQQVIIVTNTSTDEIMSFNSKLEAMRFCEEWNSRTAWIIEYHLENDGERVAIWNLTKQEGKLVAERIEEEIMRLIYSENEPDWNISVKYQSQEPSKNGAERIFRVSVRKPNDQKDRYRYQIYYAPDGKGINTLTQQSVTYKRRVRIDRQRGRILEAMSKVPNQLGLYFGAPDADLEWLNLGPVL